MSKFTSKVVLTTPAKLSAIKFSLKDDNSLIVLYLNAPAIAKEP
jgi:hypothetical protein